MEKIKQIQEKAKRKQIAEAATYKRIEAYIAEAEAQGTDGCFCKITNFRR